MKKHLRKLHRSLAWTIGLVLIWWTVTGVLLNHTQDFKLDRPVGQAWLNHWYGITPPQRVASYPLQNHWLTQMGTDWYWDHTQLAQQGHIQSVVITDWVWVLSQSYTLSALTPSGEWIESVQLPSQSPSHEFVSCPQANQRICLKQNQQFWGLTDSFEWQPESSLAQWQPLEVVKPAQPPEALQHNLIAQYPSSLTYEKVILEAHNGWLFGQIGAWLLDLFALLVLVMIVTGIWLKTKRV